VRLFFCFREVPRNILAGGNVERKERSIHSVALRSAQARKRNLCIDAIGSISGRIAIVHLDRELTILTSCYYTQLQIGH